VGPLGHLLRRLGAGLRQCGHGYAGGWEDLRCPELCAGIATGQDNPAHLHHCYLWLIIGAFGKIVGYDLMTNPTVPLGILAVILMGLLAGQMTYRWKQDIILTTVITVVVSFVGIGLGTLTPIQGIFAGLNSALGDAGCKFFCSFIVLVICYLGSVLPIWRWAQPINFVSFWIIALGMLGGVIGMLIWHPGFGDFPLFTSFTIGIGPL